MARASENRVQEDDRHLPGRGDVEGGSISGSKSEGARAEKIQPAWQVRATRSRWQGQNTGFKRDLGEGQG